MERRRSEAPVHIATDPQLSRPARLLAREVLIHGPITRAALADRLGLSLASLTRLSKPFLDAGILIESADAQSVLGRPARPLDVKPDARTFLGIKLTGESAAGVLTDLRARVLAEYEAPLPGHSPDAVLDVIEDVAGRLRGPTTAAVGVSIGGLVARGGVVRRAPFLGWRDVPLGPLVEQRLGLHTFVENDLVALTVAEQWFGEGRGRPDFALLTIGAGVGYGLVMRDEVVARPDAGVGFAGHIPLDANGPVCMEGHRGCSSAVLTMPAICGQVSDRVGRQVGYDEALDLAMAGDEAAAQTVHRAARALGSLIALVANLAMVDAVILTGEGVRLAESFRSMVDEAIRAGRDPEAIPVELNLQRTDFPYWARGAASVGIERTVLGES
jgi:predicted NBD/HSP70 family sugar kinase